MPASALRITHHNPYRRADDIQRLRQRAESPYAALLPWLPALLIAASLPLLQGAEGPWRSLDAPAPAAAAVAARDLTLRVGLLLCAGLSLSAYQRLVRGPDRGVIDLHPLLPGPWLLARAPALARDALPWLAAALAPLLPFALRRPDLALPAALTLAGAWLSGLGLGVGVNLVAPAVGTSPAWAPVLDAIRGVNPRMQAALLYAPGAAVGLSGLSLIGATAGLDLLAAGSAPVLTALALLSLPWIAGIAGAGLAWIGRARASALPLVLGEVEAAWAAQEDPGEARSAYLDWVAAYLPPAWRPALLKDLRQGWREERPSLIGAWGVGALAALAAWGRAPLAGWLVLAGCAWIGHVGVRMRLRDPAWLDQWLPAPRALPARALALWLWMLPLIALPALAAWWRGHPGPAATGLPAAAALALTAAALPLRDRDRAARLYPAAALLLLAGFGAA